MDTLTYTSSCLCICRMKDVYERTYAGTVGDLCFLFLISKSSGAEPVNATSQTCPLVPLAELQRERENLRQLSWALISKLWGTENLLSEI